MSRSGMPSRGRWFSFSNSGKEVARSEEGGTAPPSRYSLPPPSCSACDQIRLRRRWRDDRAVRTPIDIHLAPHPELARQVDPRLDGEAAPRKDLPVVAGLVVVHVGAGAVQVVVDRVPGPVHEVVAEARPLDHVPRRAVHLVPLEALPRGPRAA